jgi:hypothetical protein
MKVAVITMVHNEAFFLPLWYRYYGSQLGHDNLYVIDHGSTDGSVSETFGNRIRIARDKFDDVSRAVMVSDLHRALLRFYDTVIYTDVDEFIVPRPGLYGGITDYAERNPGVSRCVGINVVPQSTEEPPLDLFYPVLQQRPYGFASHWYFKPLLSSEPINWEPGFHYCKEPARFDADLWLFHMKYLAKPGEEFFPRLRAHRTYDQFEAAELAGFFEHRRNSELRPIPAEFLAAV